MQDFMGLVSHLERRRLHAVACAPPERGHERRADTLERGRRAALAYANAQAQCRSQSEGSVLDLTDRPVPRPEARPHLAPFPTLSDESLGAAVTPVLHDPGRWQLFESIWRAMQHTLVPELLDAAERAERGEVLDGVNGMAAAARLRLQAEVLAQPSPFGRIRRRGLSARWTRDDACAVYAIETTATMLAMAAAFKQGRFDDQLRLTASTVLYEVAEAMGTTYPTDWAVNTASVVVAAADELRDALRRSMWLASVSPDAREDLLRARPEEVTATMWAIADAHHRSWWASLLA